MRQPANCLKYFIEDKRGTNPTTSDISQNMKFVEGCTTMLDIFNEISTDDYPGVSYTENDELIEYSKRAGGTESGIYEINQT